jgi:hypothetical protein
MQCRHRWMRQLIPGELKSRESKCEREVVYIYSYFYFVLNQIYTNTYAPCFNEKSKIRLFLVDGYMYDFYWVQVAIDS